MLFRRAEHFQCVACILMHDQTMHGTLFNNPFGYVHLDARRNHTLERYLSLSDIHYFVQQVARYGA